MAKKIVEYDEKFTSAKTIYADIDLGEKLRMIDTLANAFYDALEDANYKDRVRRVLQAPYPDFRKHTKSGDRTLNNSLQSFLAGLLRQHHGKPNKDISTKMLKGIQVASFFLKELGYDTPEYEFAKRTNRRTPTTPYEKLFQ